MADTQMMRLARFSVSERQPLLLVTDDEALCHLIELEAREIALPMLTVRELPHERSLMSEQAVILDLDSAGGMQAALYGQTDAAIGLCHSATALPDMLLTRVLYLLERPFLTSELRALLGQLRRGELSMVRPADELDSGTDVVLSLEGEATLLCNGRRILLTPKEAVLIKCLLEHRGEVVTREQLRECLHTPDKKQTDDTNKTEVYLCYLRRKLEKPTGRKMITTVRGVGYRLE